ncbi:MAG: hypothetical protein EOP87_22555 [Verrucomicrobiaceae bacterium]|nr:MAG: hypothetical protein EOP87_22555 [Verrucomicrobiaceae bacterium]
MAKPEMVMVPGMRIETTTAAGKISVAAGKDFLRSYTWEGETRSATLFPRTERWYGSLGAYYPGPGEHWKEHNGITRGVLQEGQQHFKDANEAQAWIKVQKGYYPLAYRNDGLMVAFGKVPARKQINVEVWQIFISGKKPVKLEGADDSAIRLIQPE